MRLDSTYSVKDWEVIGEVPRQVGERAGRLLEKAGKLHAEFFTNFERYPEHPQIMMIYVGDDDFPKKGAYRFIQGDIPSYALYVDGTDATENARQAYVEMIDGAGSFLDLSKEEIKERKAAAKRIRIDAHLLSARKLGWINCDKFILNGVKRVDMMVDADPESRTFLFFREMNAALSAVMMNESLGFLSVPVGQSVQLVSIRMTDGKTERWTQALETGESVPQPDYQPMSLNEIHARLDQVLTAANG